MSTTRRSRLSIWWWEMSYRVGPNLWVAPVLMSSGAVLLFGVTRWMDRNLTGESARLPALLIPDTTGDAAIVLVALLGAIATALALVFSTSILTFSIASSQLGPRLIRRFISDPVTQLTLGAFLGTLIFLVLTLASVRSGRADGVPEFSAAVAVLLSLGCFGLLVFYVHRVAATIQAPNVVASVVSELHHVLDELDTYLPSVPRPTDPAETQAAVAAAHVDGAVLGATRTGYVELIDHPRLLDAANAAGAVVVLDRRPGQFVIQGQVVARILPPTAVDSVRSAVAEAVEIGPSRTLRQDLEFAIAQVVEIALRALSPAVNDTYTGLTCVDWLSSAVVQIGQHPMSDGGMCSDGGELRLVVPPLHFERVVKAAFDLIREAGSDSPAVLIRLLDAVTAMAPMVMVDHVAPLRSYADLILETAHAATFASSDLADLAEHYRAAAAALDLRG